MRAVASVVFSDLHLGAASGRDLLRRPTVREALIAGLDGADRVILLGDLLELRESPVAAALAVARPFLEELGAALDGRPVTIVPGNHDHQLAAPLLERLQVGGEIRRLGLAATAPAPSSGPLGEVAAAIGGPVELSYPGVWLRDDVWASHGHYLDVENTVPTLERLSIGLVERVASGGRRERRGAADYEAAVAPIYALIYAIAQGSSAGRKVVGGGASVRLWEALGESESSNGGVRAAALRTVAGLGVSGAVAALNRAGLGPLNPDLSSAELRRAGLVGMGRVAERLGVDASWVLFGHTHRSGPHEGAGSAPLDDGPEWTTPGGARLLNTGCWIHEPAFLGADPKASPYFPGTCAFVPDEGPPRLRRLLDELPPVPAATGT